MSAHSLNSPSSFSRRIGCPGSANMERDIPSESSIYADEGTAAHELGETCLRKGDEPEDYRGETIVVEKEGPRREFEVNGDMISAVDVYMDHCRPLMGRHMIEHKFKLPFLGPEEKGTSDFTALTLNFLDKDQKRKNILHVVDYKHGKGETVEAKGNVQGLCYGLGAAQEFQNEPWDILRITIVQPRAYHDDGPVRSWDVPRDELFDYLMKFADAAKKTEDKNAPLKVGPWCRFCKAKVGCPAQLKNATDTMEMDFEEETSQPVPAALLSDEKILDLIFSGRIKLIEQWCQSLKDYAQKKAEAGDPIKGSKLVFTRAVRMWKDKDQAQKALGGKYPQLFTQSFCTAPQAEKILGKKEFKEVDFLVDKVSTGVTLVPESDPRDSARGSVQSDFSDFND